MHRHLVGAQFGDVAGNPSVTRRHGRSGDMWLRVIAVISGQSAAALR
jgi:hypothetical protein